MKIRLPLLTLILSLYINCPAQTHPTRALQSLAGINSIQAGHGIHLVVLPSNRMNGRARIVYPKVHHTQTTILGSKLTLRQNRGFTRRDADTIIVYLPSLHKITTTDNASATIRNVPTNHLHILSESSGNISCEGNINLSALSNFGSGEVRVYWVNSDFLSVSGFTGQAQLAGVTTHLLIEGAGNFIFDGEFLRSQKTWVHAHNQSIIKTMPLNTLNASAANFAQIAYFHFLDKEHLSEQTTEFGNVLFVLPTSYPR